MCNVYIPKYIISLFKDEILEICETLLKTVASDHDLDYEALRQRYIMDIHVVENSEEKLEIKKKHKYIQKQNKTCKCFAYSSKGLQCGKSKLNGQKFCFIHMHEQRFGTIDCEFVSDIVEKNKRTYY